MNNTTDEQSVASGVSQEERTWATLAHLSGFLAGVIPLGHLIGPFLIWWIKRDALPFTSGQAKEALNFQITMTIYAAISMLLMFVIVGVFLLMAVGVFDIVMMIVAAVKANKGEDFQYPLTYRIIR